MARPRCAFREFVILTASVGGEELFDRLVQADDDERQLIKDQYDLDDEQISALISRDPTLIQDQLDREADNNPACAFGQLKTIPVGLMTAEPGI